MGNRAVITSINSINKNGEVINPKGTALYLHWNGGRDSVRAFLKYCELRGFRAPDDDYGWARLTQIVSNYFGVEGLSIGVGNAEDFSTMLCDNGIYLIKGWKIMGRVYAPSKEQTNYKLADMLKGIDESQPEEQRLGNDFLEAKETSISNIKVGDYVFIRTWEGYYESFEVLGFGGDRIVEGTRVFNVPYIGRYVGLDGGYEDRLSNYLCTYGKKFRVTDKKCAHPYSEAAKEMKEKEEMEQKNVTNDYPDLGKYQYAATFTYSEGSNSTYIFKTIEDARQDIEDTIGKMIKEFENDKAVSVQTKLKVDANSENYVLYARTPFTEYATIVVASISKIYC